MHNRTIWWIGVSLMCPNHLLVPPYIPMAKARGLTAASDNASLAPYNGEQGWFL